MRPEERWSDSRACARVIKRLTHGRSVAVDSHEGRVDLRALPAPGMRFDRVRLEGLDLSDADLRGASFTGCTLVDCRFDGARCDGWRLWDTEVIDSTFAGATFRDAAIGTWDGGLGNSWRRVHFEGADLRVAAAAGVLFEDCSFGGARLDGVSFQQCTFARCRFARHVSDVVFDGREISSRAGGPGVMDGVDMTDAVLADVEFMGLDLTAVGLPAVEGLRVVRNYGCVVRHVLALIGDGDSVALRMLRGEFEQRLRTLRANFEDNVFNRRDYVASGGEELADLADALIAGAEAKCRTPSESRPG